MTRVVMAGLVVMEWMVPLILGHFPVTLRMPGPRLLEGWKVSWTLVAVVAL